MTQANCVKLTLEGEPDHDASNQQALKKDPAFRSTSQLDFRAKPTDGNSPWCYL